MIEQGPNYRPELLSMEEVEVFTAACRKLLPEKQPSVMEIPKLEEEELSYYVSLFSAAGYELGNSTIEIQEHETMDSEADQVKVTITTPIEENSCVIKEYTCGPTTGFTLYWQRIKTRVEDTPSELPIETQLDFASYRNSDAINAVLEDHLMGLHDFTSIRLEEVLTFLAQCNPSNRIY